MDSTDEATINQWWETYWDCTERCDEVRVTVYLRSVAPALGIHSQRIQFLQALADAADSGLFDSYDVAIIGDELCVCERCRNLASIQPTIETVLRLMSWRDGGIRSSGFVRCESSSTLAGESHVTVTPPELTAGVYADDTLIGVFPCRADERTYSPAAFLGQLLREGSSMNEREGEQSVHTAVAGSDRPEEDIRPETDIARLF
ncbi:HTH domain-containing protein [Halovenus marina]|uniref:HTH domain-containing protein n=1 Tax=Halovenus marina TaxID=3396621 RepID=UPI003F564C8A